jgi:hypothetical protein
MFIGFADEISASYGADNHMSDVLAPARVPRPTGRGGPTAL